MSHLYVVPESCSSCLGFWSTLQLGPGVKGMVCLCGFGQFSPHESAFEIDLGSNVIFLHSIIVMVILAPSSPSSWAWVERVLEWVRVPHWLENGLMISGKSSPHELVFGLC